MQYKIFYTDVPLPSCQGYPDHAKLIPMMRDTRRSAIDTACEFLARDAVVWRIEGPDTDISREEVEHEWRLRR